MDKQQYISSGAIEAYVLGIASAEEVRELELLIAQDPEIAAAVEDCRQTMASYTRMLAQDPPQGLKEKIWQQIAADDNNAASTVQTADKRKRPDVRPVSVPRRAQWGYTAMAAALGLLLGTTLMNIRHRSENRIMQNELSQLRSEQGRMQNEMNSYRDQLQLFADPAMRNIALAGVGAHTENSAMVLWDTRSGDVYLTMRSMPQAPAGKQYQLWAIVDGKPVDLGVFPKDGTALLGRMKAVPKAEMFAITLEQEGGSPAPTLDQMFVAGKA